MTDAIIAERLANAIREHLFHRDTAHQFTELRDALAEYEAHKVENSSNV